MPEPSVDFLSVRSPAMQIGVFVQQQLQIGLRRAPMTWPAELAHACSRRAFER
jgi:hypothetical protein